MEEISLWQAAMLALVQGITEFLPISSSAHLLLLSHFWQWPDQGLAFDSVLHFGTLAAVLWHFRRQVITGIQQCRHKNGPTPQRQLLGHVALASLPVLIVGFLGREIVATQLRSLPAISAATIGFGLVLAYAAWRGRGQRDEYSLRWQELLFIGLCQTLALIPGASRAGLSLSAALLVGLQPVAAARFSLLLAIPVIAAASGWQALQLLAGAPLPWAPLGVALLLSFFSARLCIAFFLRWLPRIGLYPFVGYRLLLGLLLLVTTAL